MKIMIADDDFIVRYGIRESIDWEKYGFEIVCEASNADEAFEKYTEFMPDIVITDICMDDTNGLDFAARAAALGAGSTEFIVLSGYAEFDYAKKAMEIGIDKYLLKPVKNEELIGVLLELKKKIENKAKINNTIKNYYVDLPQLKNNAVRRMLEGEVKTAEEVKSYCEKYDIRLPERFYLVAVLKGERQADENESELSEKSITECIYSYGELYGVICRISAEKSALILHCETDSEDIPMQLFNDVLSYHAVLSERQLNIGISSISDDFSLLPQLYRQAETAAEENIMHSGTISIYRDESEGTCRKREVRRAIEIIRRDYALPITVGKVAQELFVSPSYFMALFKKDMGKTFSEYLTEYRLKKAIEMMRMHEYKIYEISNMVGYKNSKYFSQAFKRYTGCTPKEYMQRVGEAEK